MRINTFHRSLTIQCNNMCSKNNVFCGEQNESNNIYDSKFLLNNNNYNPTKNSVKSDMDQNNHIELQITGTNKPKSSIIFSFTDNIYRFLFPNKNINLGNSINTDLIKISDNFVHINGNFSSETITTSGDINGDNLSLIGDIIATNIQTTGYIKSQVMLSDGNIELIPATNNTIDMGNVRHGIKVLDTNIINILAIKNNKIFICTTDVLLESDKSINGIEIIIINNNPKTNIKIRDESKIISILDVDTSIRMVYIGQIARWIII